MKSKAEIHRNKGNIIKRWNFRIIASNGRIVAHGEGYVRKQGAIKAVQRLLELPDYIEVMVV